MTAGLPRVLVVDDDDGFRSSVVRTLRHLGYDPVEASGGLPALDALRSEHVDAVLLDLLMPDLSGHAVLRLLARDHGGVPVIAVSGSTEVDDVVQAFRGHAIDFLQKPVRPTELAAALDRALTAPPPRQPVPGTPPPVAAPWRSSTPVPPASPSAAPRTDPPSPARPETPPSAEVPASSTPASPPVPPATTAPRGQAERVDAPTSVRTPVAKLVADLREGRVQLPAIAPIAGEVQRLMNAITTDVDEVTDVVGRDPVIVGAILRMANTVELRGAQSVTNLRAACLRLGNKRVLTTAQEVLLREQFIVGAGPAAELVTSMWQNVIVTAHIARHLTVLLQEGDPDDVHMAALLHNLGEVVLLRLMLEIRGDRPLDDAFRESIAKQVGDAHEEVGRLLLVSWDVPERYVKVAGSHHRPPFKAPAGTAARIAHIVQTAWLAACSARFTYLPGQGSPDLGPHLAALDVSRESLDDIVRSAMEWLLAQDEEA